MNGQHLSPGLTIWARNHEALGIIVQVLGDYLRLRTDEGKEYWLPANAVRLDQDRAVVEFRSGELLSFTVPAPDAYDESQYIETEHRTDEEEKQRAQVLRELSE